MKKRLGDLTPTQVYSVVQELALGGDHRPGLKRSVKKTPPWGMELKIGRETYGTDIYKVVSLPKPSQLRPAPPTAGTGQTTTRQQHDEP